MFNDNNNDDQKQQASGRRQPPGFQQNQYPFGEQTNNYQQQQQQQHYSEHHHQQQHHPQGRGDDRRMTTAQQQAYNPGRQPPSAQHLPSWMTGGSASSGGGGGILPPGPLGLGEGESGGGTRLSGSAPSSSSLLPPDPPTISSAFGRGAGPSRLGGGGGAFGAVPSSTSASAFASSSSSGGLHRGGPYRGPTPPAPGSGFGPPRQPQQQPYQQDHQDVNVDAPPFYPRQPPAAAAAAAEGGSPTRMGGRLPSLLRRAEVGRQASINEVVQEVPSSSFNMYRPSPYDFGGGDDEESFYHQEQYRTITPVNPYQQQQDYQYHQHQEGAMGSIGEYSHESSSLPYHYHQHFPRPPSGTPSSPQRSHSRNSSRYSSGPSPGRPGSAAGGRGGTRPGTPSSPQRSHSRNSSRYSAGPSPARPGSAAGGRGGTRPHSRNSNRSGGGRGGGGRGRPSSYSSVITSGGHPGSPMRPISTVHRTESPAPSELEVFSSPTRQYEERPGSAMSGRASRNSRASHGSGGSGRDSRNSGRRSKQRSESRTSTATPGTPKAQNLRGDPFRKSKVKTELCRVFMKGEVCQYGDTCNFAHGQSDLKHQTLLEMENAGTVDAEIYRTRACFAWVATGSCPFEQRCIGLHDPRVIGNKKHWLAHADTDKNKILTGRNVDKTFHSQWASIYNCSPLYGYVPPSRWKEDRAQTMTAWKHFYAYVCNIRSNPVPVPQQQPSELLRVYMAIKMREARAGQIYVYYPSHLLWEKELCMLLKRMVFAVPKRGVVTSNDILDITGDETYGSDPRKEEKYNIHSAHLIAFGPVGDPESRGVSLWFDLLTDDIRECNVQESNKYKRSRHLLKPPGDKDTGREKKRKELSTESYRREHSVVGLQESTDGSRRGNQEYEYPHFYSHQPLDNDAFDLVTNILEHRLHFLDSCAVMPQDAGSRTRKDVKIRKEEEGLIARFKSLRRHWATWSWPVRSGVQVIDENTPIPLVESEYYFGLEDPLNFQVEIFSGIDENPGLPDVVTNPMTKAAVGFLWESFLINCQLVAGKKPSLQIDAQSSSSRALASVDKKFRSLRRLPVLRLLSIGFKVSEVDYNENYELPMLSGPIRTQSLEALKSPLLSNVDLRIPSPRTISDEMEAMFKEWEELFAHMTATGPFKKKDGEGEEIIEEEEQQQQQEEEGVARFASPPVPTPTNDEDDEIVDIYINTAAVKETRGNA